MKFRYKVLFTNLILLSVGLGVGLVCYLMINKNFEHAKQTQLKNAIMQNNLVQSSVEYKFKQGSCGCTGWKTHHFSRISSEIYLGLGTMCYTVLEIHVENCIIEYVKLIIRSRYTYENSNMR